MAIGPGAAEERARARRTVLGGEARKLALDLQLALVEGQVDGSVQPGLLGHVDEQGVDGRRADHGEHLGSVRVGQR